MFRWKLKTLALRFIIAGVLALGLIIMPAGSTVTKARTFTTCEQCDTNYANCSNGCIDQPSGCQSFCDRIYARCLATCQ